MFVAASLGGGALFYRQEAAEVRAETVDELSSITAVRLREVTGWLNERHADAERSYDNPAIAPWLEQFYPSPATAPAPPVLSQWMAKFISSGEYDDVLLVSPDGDLRLSATGREADGVAPPIRATIRDAIASRRVGFADFHRDRPGDANHPSFVVPIFRQRAPRDPLGALLLRVDATRTLEPMLAGWPSPHVTAETVLVRRDGARGELLSPTRFPVPAGAAPGGAVLAADIAASEPTGAPFAGLNYRGHAVTAVAMRVGASDWTLLSHIDDEEIARELHVRGRVIALFVGLVMFSAIVTVGWFRHRHQLTLAEAERAQSERVRATAAQLQRVLRNSPTILYTMRRSDAGFRPIEVSENIERIFGHTVEEALAPGWWMRHLLATEFEGARVAVARLDTHDEVVHEFRFHRKDGRLCWIQDTLRCLRREDGRAVEVAGAWTDVTALKLTEARAQRLTQLYAALSACNEAVARATDEATLFDAVCHAAVDHGGLSLAWIGQIDRASQRIVPVVRVGEGTQYLDGLEFSTDPASPYGQGPAGCAARERRPCWSDDFGTDERMAPWRERAALFGLHAAGCLPLVRDGEPVAILAIYTTDPDGIDEEARRLLTAMAANISFALDSLARDARRAHAEARLLESELRYRTIFTLSSLPMLLIEPETGAIRDANEAASTFYGWNHRQLLAMNISEINTMPSGEIEQEMHKVERGTERHFDFRHRLANGDIREVEVFSGRVLTSDRHLLLSTIVNVQERRNAERALRTSLREKDVLLMEVHHRVKYNLQLISSLLRLESGRSDESTVHTALADMQGRILSMALLHETLYRARSLAHLDLAQYLSAVAQQAFRSLGSQERLSLHLDLADAEVEPDLAIPCGLIVNELVANAMKHAFVDGRTGTITVRLQRQDTRLRLEVADTGRGLPDDFEARRATSLGLHIVSVLTRQLRGDLQIRSDHGAAFLLEFDPQPVPTGTARHP